MKINYKGLAFHLLVPIMLLFIILMLIPDYSINYTVLKKPFPNMPSYIFFGLYILMYFIFGVAAYLGEEDLSRTNKAMSYYYISLFVNLLYIPIIFGTKNLFVGFLWSVHLLVIIYFTFSRFRKINKHCARLFLIYFIYSLFLVYYSFFIYIFNK